MTWFLCGVLLLLVFSSSAEAGQVGLGDRCQRSSDCQVLNNNSGAVCRWAARACGFGVCVLSLSANNRILTTPRRQGGPRILARATTVTRTSTTTIGATGPRSPQIIYDVKYGEICNQQRLCVPELSCFAGKCGCPTASRYFNGRCEQNQPSDPCSRDEDCVFAQNTVCSSVNKNCTCRLGYKETRIRFNDGGDNNNVRTQIRCLSNEETLLSDEGDYCGDSYPSGLPLQGNLCADGLQCTACDGDPIIFKICTKIEDQTFINDEKNADRLPRYLPSKITQCKNDDDCEALKNNGPMACLRPLEACNSPGRCACAPGYLSDPIDSVCKKSVNLGQACKNKNKDICVDKNSECINGQCQCGGKWQIGPGNRCVSERAHLFYGYACSTNNGTWDCHGNMACLANRCSCPHGQRIDSETVHLVEFFQIDGSPGRYAEHYLCIDNKIGDPCSGDEDCVLAPNSHCERSKCTCNSGFMEKSMINEAGEAILTCILSQAQRAVANGTCGSQIDGVTRLCDDSFVCRQCGGSLDRLICSEIQNDTISDVRGEVDSGNGDNNNNNNEAVVALMMRKLGDICVGDEDCATRNGDLACGFVAPVCGHYGKCVCAPGLQQVHGEMCRPTIGQRCSGECASPRMKCQYGICQCDSSVQLRTQWHSLGAKLHRSPTASSTNTVDCTVWETQFYGDPCSDTSQCIRGLRCSINGTCTCPIGHKLKPPPATTTDQKLNYQCIPVEIGDSCASDDDCGLIVNARCNVTSSECECRENNFKPVQFYYYDDSSNEALVKKRCAPVDEQAREEKQHCSPFDDDSPGGFCQPNLVCANCLLSNTQNDAFYCLPGQS